MLNFNVTPVFNTTEFKTLKKNSVADKAVKAAIKDGYETVDVTDVFTGKIMNLVVVADDVAFVKAYHRNRNVYWRVQDGINFVKFGEFGNIKAVVVPATFKKELSDGEFKAFVNFVYNKGGAYNDNWIETGDDWRDICKENGHNNIRAHFDPQLTLSVYTYLTGNFGNDIARLGNERCDLEGALAKLTVYAEEHPVYRSYRRPNEQKINCVVFHNCIEYALLQMGVSERRWIHIMEK